MHALYILQQHLGPDDLDIAPTLDSLVKAYETMGSNVKSRELLERGLPIRERHRLGGRDHAELATILTTLNQLPLW